MREKMKVAKSFQEIMGSWQEKAKGTTKKLELDHSDQKKIIKLPICKESERTIPNIIARSALFGIIKRGARNFKDKKLIASRSDVKIYYTGKTLDQADCTVWMQALSFANILGQDVPVNRSVYLKYLQKTTGKKDYIWLDGSLHRLMTGLVTVETPKGKLEFHLIDTWGEIKDNDDPSQSRYVLNINPQVIKMWSNSEYVKVEWDKRLAIKRGCDLASWLQLYIRSNIAHGKPHHISLVKLRDWCGLPNMRLRQYRVAFSKALLELTRISEIKNAFIRKDDMVIFTRISDRDSFPDDRDSNALDDRDSNTLYRDSNALDNRDSNTKINTKIDRDSNAPDDRDSNALDDRDSNALDRDSNALDRDSNALDRDSNAGVFSKSLFLKRIFGVFFS